MSLMTDWRRRRRASKAPTGPLRDYLSRGFPTAKTSIADLRLLAVDLEATGLDPQTDRLLTIGFVPVDGVDVTLAGARHLVCAQPVEPGTSVVGQSAVVHGVTDDVLATGVPLTAALEELLDALTGRVLLAHHARIEEGFIAAACREIYGVAPVFSTVDTMTLQSKVLRVDPEHAPPGSLRLAAARQHFGLPRYRSHEALTDALACAELYLAQAKALGASTLGGLQAGHAGVR